MNMRESKGASLENKTANVMMVEVAMVTKKAKKKLMFMAA
jgi:hypothetical protein